MGRRGRRGDVTRHLRCDDPVGHKRERRWRVVARLNVEPGPVDRAAVEARRGSGLEAAERKTFAGKGLRQAMRGRLADPAGGDLLVADVNETVQERAGGQHHPARRDLPAIAEHDPADPPIMVEQQILGGALGDVEIRGFGQ